MQIEQGRQTHRAAYGTDTYQEQTPTQASQRGFNAGAYEYIYLIAKPPFLGFLRSALNKPEIHKDLSQLQAKQIREYLPPVL